MGCKKPKVPHYLSFI